MQIGEVEITRECALPCFESHPGFLFYGDFALTHVRKALIAPLPQRSQKRKEQGAALPDRAIEKVTLHRAVSKAPRVHADAHLPPRCEGKKGKKRGQRRLLAQAVDADPGFDCSRITGNNYPPQRLPDNTRANTHARVAAGIG